MPLNPNHESMYSFNQPVTGILGCGFPDAFFHSRESGNVIPGIPGRGMAFTAVLLAQWRYEKP